MASSKNNQPQGVEPKKQKRHPKRAKASKDRSVIADALKTVVAFIAWPFIVFLTAIGVLKEK